MALRDAIVRVILATGLFVYLGVGSWGSARGQIASGDIENIFPLAPRELRQRLARAQAAVTEERFSDAVAEIGEILGATGSDDFFLGVPGSPDAQLSLKTEALFLLGSMPAKGRRMYELQYGADAKAALESSLAAGDLVQLTEVSRRYFHTKAGYEATILLGRVQLDQGRPLAAALTLKRVAEVPTALTQYDPELSVLLATCWIHANQPAQAEETLVTLKKRLPQARIRLVDREVGLFAREIVALDWLREIVGVSRESFRRAVTEWAVHRGDEKRNARSSGGVPLLNFNWKLPTVNVPTDEGRVAQQFRAIRDREEPLICALQPLVVQDYAIVRQPESNKLVGINMKNGKRVWVYPPFEENETTQAANQAMQANRGPLANVREQELKQRIWEDHAFGQVSSDGRQVYVIDDLSIAPIQGVNIPAVGIGPRGMRFQNPSATKSHNLLVALDLAKQGYAMWAVGGMAGDDNPALAGAFFLGPPLPAGDQLFVLAEFSGEIRLLCLDARSGALEWKQQLAVLEAAQITWDRSRRLAGASPSLADGILICPTSAGAVVAIDLATRTLRWGYQYRRNDFVPTFSRGGGFRNAMVPSQPAPGGTWLDSTATIADGCVILTPPESQQLHCLDLLTGKARWSPIPRDDMLLVACVHQGKIILIGKNRVKAVNLSDGKPAWSSDIKLEGEMAVGRGYYSDHFYHLPVSGQQLCKIDLDTGTIATRAKTEAELGNLVCYKDQLLSLSPQSVASFVLLSEHLEKQLVERLAANPDDLDALALKAQILLQEGNPDESLALLRRATALAPDRPTIHDLLVKVMMSLVRSDFAKHSALTDELDRLVTDPVQRREVLRWRVQGLVQSDRPVDAFRAILELADEELATPANVAPAPLQGVDRERNVRFDCWLQGQLRHLLALVDSATHEQIIMELKTRQARVVAAGSVHQLRTFLNLFGFLDLADATRLTLVEKLVAADALMEAEFVAGELLERQDRTVVAKAIVALAMVYEMAKRPELAARMYERLDSEFYETIAHSGFTGRELARRALVNASIAQHLTPWPIGAVDAKEGETNSAWQQRSQIPLHLTHYYGAAPRGLRANYDTQRYEVSIRGDSGQLLSTASLRGPDGNSRRGAAYMMANNSLNGKANGHLVVVNLGSEIAAVDGLRTGRGADALLWRQDSADDPTSVNPQRVFSSSRANRNPLLGNRTVTYDAGGRQSFGTGPVLSSGVVFQRGRQLVSVDPISGQPLWERSSTPQTEIPQQAELFGDGELLFVADARLESKANEALVLSTIDGGLLGRRSIDPAERRWVTYGRNVLTWEEKNSVVKLRLIDVWDNGRELWSRQVARATRGHLIDGEELAILEPGGQFSVVSLATGRLQFGVPLDPEPSLAWIQVIRASDQYLLLASQDVTPGNGGLSPLPISNGVQQRGMHGRTYAFDRKTGKLQWPGAAFVSKHWLPPDQPTESPLLFFVAMRQSNNKNSTVVLALDRRTGQEVYANDLAGAIAVSCDIVAEQSKQMVTLSLVGQGNRTVAFHLTDKARPPQPPAQLGEMANNTAGLPGGVVEYSGGAVVELLHGGIGPAPREAAFPTLRRPGR